MKTKKVLLTAEPYLHSDDDVCDDDDVCVLHVF